MTKSKGIIIKNPETRFWNNIQFPIDDENCWVWIGRKNAKGYGRMKINGKHVPAHRFSYEMHKAKVPEGVFVLHKCDNPSCVSPYHLFLGTVPDNNLDRDKKGRVALGERNGNSKLSLDQVVDIKQLIKMGEPISEIAKMFGSKYSTINSIKRERSWAWVKG